MHNIMCNGIFYLNRAWNLQSLFNGLEQVPSDDLELDITGYVAMILGTFLFSAVARRFNRGTSWV